MTLEQWVDSTYGTETDLAATIRDQYKFTLSDGEMTQSLRVDLGLNQKRINAVMQILTEEKILHRGQLS